MAKAKAPSWLTTAFAEGVVELAPPRPRPAYKGALGRCWLAQHDPRRRPCSGPFQRFHFLRRQTVESAVADLLADAQPEPGQEDAAVIHRAIGPTSVDVLGPTRKAALDYPGIGRNLTMTVGAEFADDRAAVLDEARPYEAQLLREWWASIVPSLILLAAWDSRNGGIGCEGHHRRYDSHLTPALDLRYEHLPSPVIQFAFDWGIERLLDRFASEI